MDNFTPASYYETLVAAEQYMIRIFQASYEAKDEAWMKEAARDLEEIRKRRYAFEAAAYTRIMEAADASST